MKSRSREIIDILMPSWSEVVLVVIAMIAMAIYLFFKGFYELGDVQTYFAYIEKNPTTIQYEYDSVSNAVNGSRFAADAAVFAVWASVGLIAYGITESFISFFRNMKQLSDSLNYSNTKKSNVVKETAVKFIIRITAIELIYVLISVVVAYVIPYLLTILLNLKINDLINISLSIITLLLVTACLIHIVTVLLRIVTLRRRLILSYALPRS